MSGKGVDLRLPLAAAAVVRVAVAVLLFVAPQFFPLRDYGVVDETASSLKRVWRRPAIIPIAEDELAYDAIARSISAGRGWVTDRAWMLATPGEPTAYAGAAYPLFVAAVYRLTGNGFPIVVTVQIALAVWAVWGLAQIVARVMDRSTAIVAAWLMALHPGLAMVPSLLMTEALSVPLLVATTLLAIRLVDKPTGRRGVLLGGGVGLGFLVRSPLGLMGLAGLLAAAVLLVSRAGVQGSARHVGIGSLVVLVTLTPWTARNYVHYGRLIPTDTKSGVNLWMYNIELDADGWKDLGDVNEGEADRIYRRRAVANIRAHPIRFARATAVRAVEFWWPVPRRVPTMLHWLGVLLYTALTLAAVGGVILVIGGVRQRTESWILLAELAVAWGLISITATGLRHRLTVEPILVGTAATCLVWLWRRRGAGAPTVPPFRRPP